MKTRAGFTLIEMLVVIAIIGILTAIGAANLPRDKFEVREASRVISADILRARSEAIRLNTKIELAFNTTSDCYTMFEIEDQDGNPLSSPVKVSERCIGAEFPLTDLSAASFTSGSKVRFDGRGLPRNDSGGFSSGSIEVRSRSDNTYILKLNVALQGRVRVEKVSL